MAVSTGDLSEQRLDFILPKLPFKLDFPTGLRPGAKITINAVPLHGGNSFTIYICCKGPKEADGYDDVGFMLRAIMNNKETGRKVQVFTREGKKLKLAERDMFKASKRFEMVLEVKAELIECHANGHLIYGFGHVVPYTDLTELNIADDLIVEKVIYDPGHSFEDESQDLGESVKSLKLELESLRLFVDDTFADLERAMKMKLQESRKQIAIKLNAVERVVDLLSPDETHVTARRDSLFQRFQL